MVNSACSSASTESAPAGFPGLTADAVADAVADVSALHSLVPRERPSSADLQFASHGLELQLKDLLPLLSPSKTTLHPGWFYSKHQGKQKRPFSSSKLSSISRRGRFDSAFRIAADFYPLPRWRPVRSRRNSAQNSIVDLRQLSENFREFERKNRRKSVTRFFNC